MRRIFGDYAYGPGPREGCWWDMTCDMPQVPRLEGDLQADIAIIGAGYTGLNAALTLAKGGAQVVVLEAGQPGFGASGRNGGFCCLGGGRAEDSWLDARLGRDARLEWRRTERDAVDHVSGLIDTYGWDVDRHSQGETLLAHKPMTLKADGIEENYGVAPETLGKEDLASAGMGGPFHGALTIPIGFGLNPRKYLAGLLQAVLEQGVQVYGQTPVQSVADALVTPRGRVRADRILIATNGYSSEDIPPWLRARYMPAQSTVIVTRPLTETEYTAQGWTSDQMCYDTRNLLHYFRLMPDRRFLFGMRGGIFSGSRFEAAARRNVRRDFEQIFPAWKGIELESAWSGLVALAWKRLPFVGALPDSRMFAAMCFHGNGVAMGSYAGHLAARLLLDQGARVPVAMRTPLARFPLGPWRRLLMPPFYAGLALADR